ncbi:hypothetical protein [Clostridium sp. UBA4548]|nr:hypothetical protein [Clostridium sp. UBA4548]
MVSMIHFSYELIHSCNLMRNKDTFDNELIEIGVDAKESLSGKSKN